jgi:hypothetical protein
MRKRFKRFSRRASEEETLDVEKAVNKMIDKLLEESKKKNTTQVELRKQIEAVVQVLQVSENPAANAVEQQVSPEDKTDPTTGILHLRLQPPPNYLTPQILVDKVGKYLHALGQIQSVANEIKKVGNQPLNIIRIEHGNPIRVTVTNAKDALAIVRQTITPWINENSTETNRIADQLQQSEFDNKFAERNKIALATQVIANIGPALDDADRITFLARIVPAVHTLMFSEIILV